MSRFFEGVGVYEAYIQKIQSNKLFNAAASVGEQGLTVLRVRVQSRRWIYPNDLKAPVYLRLTSP